MTGLRVSVRRRLVPLALFASLVSLLAPGHSAAENGSGTFIGVDGLTYFSAPLVLDGADGELFYGPELDVACGVGDRLEVPMKAISRLARVIERSGRKVVFSIAPGKSATMAGELGELPHGVCDQQGLAAQNRVLDDFRDPAYLPLRRKLTGAGRQLYWKTDLHWTTVGGAEYAKALAGRLDRRLGRLQRYTYGSETRLGLLAQFDNIAVPETLQTAHPAGKVKVRNAKGAPPWSGYPEFTFYNSWVSSPDKHTWPGRTLLLGDSFMWYALENLRPIFRRGEFIWFVAANDKKFLAKAIKRADTVVIEVYQMVTPGTPLASAAFRKYVSRVLSKGPGK